MNSLCTVRGETFADMEYTPGPFLEGRAKVPSMKKGFRGVFGTGKRLTPYALEKGNDNDIAL